ncbi:MAG: hypothetical protein HS122_16685 [Opitutaceae bacterium]|nr:hypothetical protein [Opitutaceae bacterium]
MAASVAINGIVDQISFPNRSPRAFAQVHPLMILFIALIFGGLLCWYRTLKHRGSAQ